MKKESLIFKTIYLTVSVVVFLASGGIAFGQWTDNGTNLTTSDNVGIGTTTPTSKLHIGPLDGNHLYLGSGNNNYGWRVDTQDLSNGNVPLRFFKRTNGIDTEVMTIRNESGSVGIGTNNPKGMLSIQSTTQNVPNVLLVGGYNASDPTNRQLNLTQILNATTANQFIFLNGTLGAGSAVGSPKCTSTYTPCFGIESNDSNMNLITGSVGTNKNIVRALSIVSSGNIGLGTTTPTSKLHIGPLDGNHLYLGSGNNKYGWKIDTQDLSNGNVPLRFFKRTNGTDTEVMTIRNEGGNVGIGTTSPTSKLDVAGDIKASGNISAAGNITAKYQDLAEWVPAAKDLSAGTVVALDPAHPQSVMSSSIAYDTRVAGVVTGNPGILLGEGGEGKVKVATTGRVKVKVDATSHPIQVGDLLVTSNREGYAMRSEAVEFSGVSLHRPGTVIGKALEPLQEGEGEILILLSLQ